MSYLYSGSGNSTVYMASYTPNYAGVYLVMALPVIVILTITAAGKAGRILAAASALFYVFVYMEAVQEADWQLVYSCDIGSIFPAVTEWQTERHADRYGQ